MVMRGMRRRSIFQRRRRSETEETAPAGAVVVEDMAEKAMKGVSDREGRWKRQKGGRKDLHEANGGKSGDFFFLATRVQVEGLRLYSTVSLLYRGNRRRKGE